MLSLLHRPQPLPLTTVQKLLDYCFGDEKAWPLPDVQAMEQAVDDATVARLVQRALEEVRLHICRGHTSGLC